MKQLLISISVVLLFACDTEATMQQSELTNEKMREYAILDCMYSDSYFPTFLVDKGKQHLIDLCAEIETKNPANLEELYALTHKYTEKFNELDYEFQSNGSEIESMARDCIAINFEDIAVTYGYDADIEELISPRDW